MIANIFEETESDQTIFQPSCNCKPRQPYIPHDFPKTWLAEERFAYKLHCKAEQYTLKTVIVQVNGIISWRKTSVPK